MHGRQCQRCSVAAAAAVQAGQQLVLQERTMLGRKVGMIMLLEMAVVLQGTQSPLFSCDPAPAGFGFVGAGYCCAGTSQQRGPRVETSLCVSHECATYTAASCAALCTKMASCTGFMLQDMTIYGQGTTCGLVGTALPPVGADWVVENKGQGASIGTHDAEQRDCCYNTTGGSAASGYEDLGAGYCTAAGGGRVQAFLCDDSGAPPPPGAAHCPSTAPQCAALCTADLHCTGYMVQNMSIYSSPSTCVLVTPTR